MPTSHSQPAQASVCAAVVAAELDRASQVARKLSLTAKNARVVVMRAGSRAASLKVISDFFDDLANKTIVLAREINEAAIGISRLAVNDWRSASLLARLERARQLCTTAAASSSLLPYVHHAECMHHDLSEQFQKELYRLASELEEIQQLMRAANVISVTSRLEATQTGEFQKVLVEMANTIQNQSDTIKAHVTRSRQLLEESLH